MDAFDESRQEMKWRRSSRRSAMAFAGLVVGALAIGFAGAEEAPPSAVEWLARADVAREQAYSTSDPQQRAEALVSSAEMLSWAKGQVFLPGGGVAPIDYERRLAEARQAAEKAGDSRDDLLDRLARLPGIDRGREGGRQKVIRPPGDPASVNIRFEGGAPAIVYARTQFPAPLRLRVRDEAGNILCNEERARGRVLCRWRPLSPQSVVVDTIAPDGGSAGAISIFTN